MPPSSRAPPGRPLSTGRPRDRMRRAQTRDPAGMTRLTIIRGGSADTSGRTGRAQRSAADAGQLVRLVPGRFVDADDWRRATPGERNIARIKAVHDGIADRLVVSHASAAALHGLPWKGEFPDVVEVIDPLRATSQALTHVRKRPGRGRRLRTQTMVANGRRLTDLVSTVVDVAISHELRIAVPALDVALQCGVSKRAIRDELASRSAVHGRHRAGVAIDLADADSGSAGESVARVALDEVATGAPAGVPRRRRSDRTCGLLVPGARRGPRVRRSIEVRGSGAPGSGPVVGRRRRGGEASGGPSPTTSGCPRGRQVRGA